MVSSSVSHSSISTSLNTQMVFRHTKSQTHLWGRRLSERHTKITSHSTSMHSRSVDGSRRGQNGSETPQSMEWYVQFCHLNTIMGSTDCLTGRRLRRCSTRTVAVGGTHFIHSGVFSYFRYGHGSTN